jgi:hypothetical protein
MKPSSKKMIKQSRDDIAKFLPTALEKAFTSYHDFMEIDFPNEAKEFGAHHTAAKVAIAHIELLMKLATLADLNDADDYPEIHGYIVEAKEEIKQFDEINGEEHD